VELESSFSRDAERLLRARGKSTRNRIDLAVMQIRCRIIHAVEQKKVEKDAPGRLSESYVVKPSGHAQMRMAIWKGYEANVLTKEEYRTARKLLDENAGKFNEKELAARIALFALVAGLQLKARSA
jgi:hypothetical protein